VSKGRRMQNSRAQQIIAAQRAAEARRKRLIAAGGAVGVVVLIVGILVAVKLVSGPATAAAPTTTASASVVKEVTSIPASVYDAIGKGKGQVGQPTAVKGKPVLTADGKPLVLYMGGEFCPYCAAERWALVEALSRFGTFTNLGQTESSSVDTDPNTPTFSFHGATYTSQYLTFQGVELYTNQVTGSYYGTLDKPTAQQANLMQEYTKGSFPFIDFGDRAAVKAVTVDPGMFAGKTHQQVADALADPSTPLAQAVGGSANAFTTIICNLTGGKPGSVCNSPAARAYQDEFGAKS
jgi:Domain of unknown function (DUF929)